MAHTAAPPATTLPAYVEYPSAQTLPGPIAFTGLTMSAFLLPADMAVLRALCQSLITTPSGGQVSFTPVLPVVMMSFTAFPQGVFVNFPDRGRATERELSFGIPGIYAGAGALGFGLLMPFLFLDNPVAMLTGRENYGYFKQWGEITLPGDGLPQAFSAEVYGCPAFAPTAQWGRQGLVALNNPQAVRAHAKSGLPPASVAGAAAWLRDRIVAGSGADPGAFAALLQGKLTQIFLKQFRDVADGTRACYQAVTRADYSVTKLASLLPEADYDYAFQALQSTPVAESLGIAPSGRTGLGLAITMDMQLETGSVLWQA
jgi:hypothetical protein